MIVTTPTIGRTSSEWSETIYLARLLGMRTNHVMNSIEHIVEAMFKGSLRLFHLAFCIVERTAFAAILAVVMLAGITETIDRVGELIAKTFHHGMPFTPPLATSDARNVPGQTDGNLPTLESERPCAKDCEPPARQLSTDLPVAIPIADPFSAANSFGPLAGVDFMPTRVTPLVR